MTDLFPLSHGELVRRAGAWLRTKGCGLVFSELVSVQAEQPDAIGWRDSGQSSFLLECKTSRSDFHADRHKAFRGEDVACMGLYRYYLCPPGMLRVADLPARWGLLYCHPKTIEVVHGVDPRAYDEVKRAAMSNPRRNVMGELRMMYSALARLKVDMGDAALHARIHLPYSERVKERKAA